MAQQSWLDAHVLQNSRPPANRICLRSLELSCEVKSRQSRPLSNKRTSNHLRCTSVHTKNCTRIRSHVLITLHKNSSPPHCFAQNRCQNTLPSSPSRWIEAWPQRLIHKLIRSASKPPQRRAIKTRRDSIPSSHRPAGTSLSPTETASSQLSHRVQQTHNEETPRAAKWRIYISPPHTVLRAVQIFNRHKIYNKNSWTHAHPAPSQEWTLKSSYAQPSERWNWLPLRSTFNS